MAKIVVVYHSGYGHTVRQAQAVVDGAAGVAGASAQLVSVADVAQHWDDLDAADAIIFGAPTYMGGVPAAFKQFMDDSSKAWFTQKWKDKIAGGFTNSASLNGDKLNTLIQLAIYAAQHSMIWVGTGLMPSNSSTSQRNDVNRMGSFLGAMAQSDSDAAPDVAPPSGDLETARLYGQRIAEVALRLRG